MRRGMGRKAAVAGIVQPVAMSYGVPFLACRGFSSLTALAEGADRLIGRRVVVLYLGDHDPSGVDMDRDLQERMRVLGADVEPAALGAYPVSRSTNTNYLRNRPRRATPGRRSTRPTMTVHGSSMLSRCRIW